MWVALEHMQWQTTKREIGCELYWQFNQTPIHFVYDWLSDTRHKLDVHVDLVNAQTKLEPWQSDTKSILDSQWKQSTFHNNMHVTLFMLLSVEEPTLYRAFLLHKLLFFNVRILFWFCSGHKYMEKGEAMSK